MPSPVTYYPIETQRQFEINRRRLHGTPYAKYFNGHLWLHDEVLSALSAPMDSSKALAPSQANRLLDPGHLPGETGYCLLPDGSAYVASLVPFRGVSLEAFRWWWWWHSEDSARYMLWYPHNHISAERTDRESFTTPGLTDEQRYIGSTHKVAEYIGASLMHIYIDFVEPAEMGLDAQKLRHAGVVNACAWVRLQRPSIRFVKMIHLARPIDGGFELRSRYWIANECVLQTPVGSIALPISAIRKSRFAKAKLEAAAYEQLLHDQIEFTHLSTILQPLFEEFGPR